MFLPMLAQPYRLYFERMDAAKNMARFYALSIEPTLFGTPCLTRRWERIGFKGQEKAHHFLCEEEAVAMFLDLLRVRRARGYRTRPVEYPEKQSDRVERCRPESGASVQCAGRTGALDQG